MNKELFRYSESTTTWAHKRRHKSPWLTVGPDGQRLTQDDIDALIEAEAAEDRHTEYLIDRDKNWDAGDDDE